MDKKIETVYRIREFNRFYTVLLGLLDRKFLDSEFSVTETRVLFELNDNDECSANDLVNKLHIDKSYLSRIIKHFKDEGLLSKQTSEKDARSFKLSLTDKGKNITDKLIGASNKQISSLLESLNLEECNDICRAMDIITEHLLKNGGIKNA